MTKLLVALAASALLVGCGQGDRGGTASGQSGSSGSGSGAPDMSSGAPTSDGTRVSGTNQSRTQGGLGSQSGVQGGAGPASSGSQRPTSP